MSRFKDEADAERLAEYWYKKAEEQMANQRATVRYRALAAREYLNRAFELYTWRLDALERDSGRYDPNW